MILTGTPQYRRPRYRMYDQVQTLVIDETNLYASLETADQSALPEYANIPYNSDTFILLQDPS